MLLSFSISNFRSFREEQTLSMVASSTLHDHEDHLCPIPGSGESLLSTAVIYGANGSGKSNLVKALEFVKSLVSQGTKPEERISRQAFAFSKVTPSEPTTAEVRFVRDGKTFSYGFKVTDTEVIEEWLVLIEGDQEHPIFERITKKGEVEVEAGEELENEGYEKVLALIAVGVRANQLFLANIRETLDPANFGSIVGSALGWFQALEIIRPDTELPIIGLVHDNPAFSDFAGTFLRHASTGISGLRVVSREVDRINIDDRMMEVLGILMNYGKQAFRSMAREVRFGENAKVQEVSLKSEHEAEDGTKIEIAFSEESDGTRRLADLLPTLYELRTKNRVFVIDEIDRSLHPLLARKFIEFFLKASTGSQSQVILTTHESNLMDPDILRRDELWFTEKNPQGATSLYSLVDFEIRPDLKIEKGYLNGRFGAIPFLGNLDKLAESQNDGK